FVLAFTASTLPRTVRKAAGSIDIAGALTVTVGLASVVYGVVNAPEVGWLTWSTLTFIGAGAILLVIFFVNGSGLNTQMSTDAMFRNPVFQQDVSEPIFKPPEQNLWIRCKVTLLMGP
ncbi:MAG: hypothetical protein KKA41_05865, partial [Proteobacteria bacterium]|nr:hypothetical protein [Pseudomonadota bacterium]